MDIRTSFAHFDRSGKGMINDDEFVTGLAELGMILSPKVMSYILSIFPRNRKGLISLKQFEIFIISGNNKDTNKEDFFTELIRTSESFTLPVLSISEKKKKKLISTSPTKKARSPMKTPQSADKNLSWESPGPEWYRENTKKQLGKTNANTP